MKISPFIVKLLLWLVGTILVIALAISAVCIYVNKKYGINLFETYNQVKLLSKPVDEATFCDNKFTDADMATAQTTVNASVAGLISYSETDGYKISTTGLGEDSMMSADLKITDKQMGAIAKTIINSAEGGMTMNFNGETVQVDLLQIKFENVDNVTGNADVNIIVKMDISSLQEKFNSFPLNMFKKYIPKTLYISSTTTIEKGEGNFAYTVKSKCLKINNLTKEQTSSLIKTLNLVAKIGTDEELNLMAGEPFANLLIGNSTNTGFAYSLKDLGAKDYSFETIGETNYFVIKK